MIQATLLSNQNLADQKSLDKFNEQYDLLVKDYLSNMNTKSLEKDKVDGEDSFEKAFSKVRGKTISASFGRPIRDKSKKSTPPMDIKSFFDKKVVNPEPKKKTVAKPPENLRTYMKKMKANK